MPVKWISDNRAQIKLSIPNLFFFLNLATLCQHITKEGRQVGGTQVHTRAGDRRSRAWTLAGPMPAGLGCSPPSGTPTPSAAHLPSLLEARLHPGGLEDPGRGRASSKGQGFLDPEPLPAVPPSSPAPSQVTPGPGRRPCWLTGSVGRRSAATQAPGAVSQLPPPCSLTWAPGLPCCPGGPGSPWGPYRKHKQALKGAVDTACSGVQAGSQTQGPQLVWARARPPRGDSRQELPGKRF